MSTILLFREKVQKPGDQALMEQQAILAITRSILASPTKEGMNISAHKFIAPAHLDLLPLFAHVADDYAEFIEPEPDRPPKPSPVILYWDNYEDQEKIEKYLNPRWFYVDYDRDERPGIEQIIQYYRPDTCIFFGDKKSLSNLAQLNHKFQKLIGFSIFMPEQSTYFLREISEEIIMADLQFNRQIGIAMERMGMPYHHPEEASFYSKLYSNREQLPKLEPFVPFGAAFEMAFDDRRGMRDNELGLK